MIPYIPGMCIQIRLDPDSLSLLRPDPDLKITEKISVPEPVEPKLFCGTGAIISYFGTDSTAPEPKL